MSKSAPMLSHKWRMSNVPPATRHQLKKFFAQPQLWDTQALGASMDEYTNAHPFMKERERRQNLLQENVDLEFAWRYPPNLFATAEHLLREAGFVLIHQTHTPRLVGYSDADKTDDCHQCWAHPKGILAQLNSCGQYPDGSLRYNSLHAVAQVDIGMGELSLASSIRKNFGSSSAYDPRAYGSHVWTSSMNCTRSPHEFLDWLNSVQHAGTIVPFSQWSINGFLAHIDVDNFLDASDPHSPVHQLRQCHPDHRFERQKTLNSDTSLRNLAQYVWDKAAQLIPTFDQHCAGLSRVVAACWYNSICFSTRTDAPLQKALTECATAHGVRRAQSLCPTTGPLLPVVESTTHPDLFQWRHFDLPLKELDRLASWSLIRHPSATDAEQTQLWMANVLTHTVDNYRPPRGFDVVDPVGVMDKNWQDLPPTPIMWENVSTASLQSTANVPTLLVAQSTSYPTAVRALGELIAHAPTDQVEQWCRTPDAAGKTLPMRLLAAIIDPDTSIIVPVQRPLNEYLHSILATLHAKVPAHTWVMSTPQSSLLGAWLWSVYASSNYHAPATPAHIHALIRSCAVLGAPVPTQWTWSHPARMPPQNHNSIIGPEQHSANSLSEAADLLPSLNQTPDRLNKMLVLLTEYERLSAPHPQTSAPRRISKM